jgi:putative ABC transport system substrate-binding protein
VPVIGDPVRLGLVASFARPGGNITGFAVQNEELTGKLMQLLKEALPRLSRVAVITDSVSGLSVRTSEVSARSLGVRLHVLKVGRSGRIR